MLMDEVQRRRWIVEDYRRRRGREFVALIPGLAALYVAYNAFHDPGFDVGGLSGIPLLMGAMAVIVAYFAHHLVNWRCPSCRRHFLDGFFLRRCPHCGAVFTEPQGDVQTDPAAVERERQAEVLLAGLESDRDGAGMTTMVGLAAFFLGLFTTFFIADSSEGPQPGGWLSQKLGPGVDVHTATQGIGLLIALLGVLMAAFGIRKLAVVRRRYKRDYLGE